MNPNDITIICDRCGKTVEGLEELGVYSAGFYRRDDIWGQFMNPDEHLLCDACMQVDPRYQTVYPSPQIGDLPK